MSVLEEENLNQFRRYLINEERSRVTVEKYVRDVLAFAAWMKERTLEKGAVLAYKRHLTEHYAPASVNSMLSSINCFFKFCHRTECTVKTLKIQRRVFASGERELSKREYEKLLTAAKNQHNERLYLLMQTVCSTGIRVSELRYITCEAVRKTYAVISGKGKMRKVFLPVRLCRLLSDYMKKQKIKRGPVFVTRTGLPLDRSNIWADMKKLCKSAGVSDKKVFPHNLRHLFARTYYSVQKDIVRLADLLGHSSVNTTRIYTMESGEIHRRQIQSLGLLRC